MTNLPAQIRQYIRDELHGTYTILFAIVEEVDEDNRRIEVSLKDKEGALVDDVPIASPYAGDNYGEIYPIEPGDEGLLLVSKEPLDDMLAEKGFVDTPYQRQHSFQDGVFFPRVWFDSETVPNHDPGDYVLAHESGTNIWIQQNGDYLVEHPSGMSFEIGQNEGRTGEHMRFEDGAGSLVELDNNPEPHDGLLSDHNIEWPDEHLRIAHNDISLTMTSDGMHIGTIEDDLDSDPYQRPEDTRSAHGELTNPYRVEMNDHRHLVPDETGDSFYLSGPPLNHRLLFDTLLGSTRTSQILNFNTPHVQDLVEYHENYHTWLESETGETLTPEIPRDSNNYPDYEQDQWADNEPVPDGEQRQLWWPASWE